MQDTIVIKAVHFNGRRHGFGVYLLVLLSDRLTTDVEYDRDGNQRGRILVNGAPIWEVMVPDCQELLRAPLLELTVRYKADEAP